MGEAPQASVSEPDRGSASESGGDGGGAPGAAGGAAPEF